MKRKLAAIKNTAEARADDGRSEESERSTGRKSLSSCVQCANVDSNGMIRRVENRKRAKTKF
jgi:hypothetical protein